MRRRAVALVTDGIMADDRGAVWDPSEKSNIIKKFEWKSKQNHT